MGNVAGGRGCGGYSSILQNTRMMEACGGGGRRRRRGGRRAEDGRGAADFRQAIAGLLVRMALLKFLLKK